MDLNVLEKRLRAVSHRSRLKLLKELRKRRRADVTTLAHAISLSMETTSTHLQRLALLDIVERRRRGKRVFYRLSLQQKAPIRHILSLL